MYPFNKGSKETHGHFEEDLSESDDGVAFSNMTHDSHLCIVRIIINFNN